MKSALLGIGLAMVMAAGCAHGTGGAGTVGTAVAERDARGAARIGQQARLVVAGPARLVHASSEQPVTWFVAARTTGGDADCTAAPAARVIVAESTRARLTIDAGHVLCAYRPSGTTDVSWHQFTESREIVWALR